MKACVFLADGFEETEAFTPYDLLKRAGVETVTIGMGSKNVVSSHGLHVTADLSDDEYTADYDVLILPGGLPGATNLASSKTVRAALLRQRSDDRYIAAICASPAAVLGPLGLLDGYEATCYPGCDKDFFPEFKFSRDLVVKSGKLITGKGPGAAWPFGLKIIETLLGPVTLEKIEKTTFIHG
jgi:DJ-1 family protein